MRLPPVLLALIAIGSQSGPDTYKTNPVDFGPRKPTPPSPQPEKEKDAALLAAEEKRNRRANKRMLLAEKIQNNKVS